MTDVRAATTHDEQRCFIPCGGEFLTGTITYPTAEATGLGVVLLPSMGTPASGRNRIWVRLARHLASLGHHALRCDFSAEGDSTGPPRVYRLDEPLADEAIAMADALREAGADRIVLVGMCFGARTALSAGALMSDVAGLGLLAPPVRDRAFGNRLDRPVSWFVKRAFSADGVTRLREKSGRKSAVSMARRKLKSLTRKLFKRGQQQKQAGVQAVSPSFMQPFLNVLDRKVPMLFLFGHEDVFYDDFVKAQKSELGKLITRAGSQISVATIDGSVHGLPTNAVQQAAIDGFERWLATL